MPKFVLLANTIMNKTDITNLKGMAEVELMKGVTEAKEELRAMKFNLAAGKVKSASAIRELRKKIARMLTFLKLNKHDNQ